MCLIYIYNNYIYMYVCVYVYVNVCVCFWEGGGVVGSRRICVCNFVRAVAYIIGPLASSMTPTHVLHFNSSSAGAPPRAGRRRTTVRGMLVFSPFLAFFYVWVYGCIHDAPPPKLNAHPPPPIQLPTNPNTPQKHSVLPPRGPPHCGPLHQPLARLLHTVEVRVCGVYKSVCLPP